MPYAKAPIIGDGSDGNPFRPDVDGANWFAIIPVDGRGIPTVTQTLVFVEEAAQAARGTVIDERDVIAEAKLVDPRLTDEQVESWQRVGRGEHRTR